MSAPKAIPHTGPEFEATMLEIDAKLASEGHHIAARQLLAVREMSLKHQVSIPASSADPRCLPPELRPYAKLGEAIKDWYDLRYGDRLKIDMSPGRTVVPIDGDLYLLKIPRIFGSVRFVTSKAFIPKSPPGSGPAICNVVQLLEHMTPAKAGQLSDEGLESINTAFGSALSSTYAVEATKHELLDFARSDFATAVTTLMQRNGRFGESKWASLQAAEKVLKAAIALQGAAYPHSHDLEKLAMLLGQAGVDVDTEDLLSRIQCSPGIRYGEESCSQDDALAALHAALELVNRLQRAGAKFQRGLG